MLEALLSTQERLVEDADQVWQALRRYSETNADFADCLIERNAKAAGCKDLVTFDSKAARSLGMRNLDS